MNWAKWSDFLTAYGANRISEVASQDVSETPVDSVLLETYLSSKAGAGDVITVGERVLAAVKSANGECAPYVAMSGLDLSFHTGVRDGVVGAAVKIAFFNLTKSGRYPGDQDKVTLDYESAIEWLKMLANHSRELTSSSSGPGWHQLPVRRVP